MTLAQELLSVYNSGGVIATPPSARDPQFDINGAYAVEAEFTQLRMAAGRKSYGLKVGYANKAM
jgi:2-keto-4-pentenoate hydratase